MRRAIEGFPVAGKSARTRIEVGRGRSQARGCFVAQHHQLIGHRAKREVIVVDPLTNHRKQTIERPRLAAHRDHGTSECFGLAAARAAKHQPQQTEQRQRAGDNGDPLRDSREGEGLAG